MDGRFLGEALFQGLRDGMDTLRILAFIGFVILRLLDSARSALEELGLSLILLRSSAAWLFRGPFRYREIVRQLDFVGVQSVVLICVTGAFTGMVLALQGDIAMKRYSAQSLIGAAVALSLARELGPVLAALMLIGRAGSAIAAELGTMRNTEQIDALSGMAVEPVQFLVVPRILATVIMTPVLTVLFEFSGMAGAYITAIYQVGLEGAVFMQSVRDYLGWDDIGHGLIKSVVFGLIVGLVSCTKGFFVTGGAHGVGLATTRAVVISSLLILASDYLMTALMFRPT
jgi:phospholipid/cholesterol/gamma-HCH transport system permease protein